MKGIARGSMIPRGVCVLVALCCPVAVAAADVTPSVETSRPATVHSMNVTTSPDWLLQENGYIVLHPSFRRAFPDGGHAWVYVVPAGEWSFAVPPTGFEPASGTASQLERYGIPPRPMDPSALDQWMVRWGGHGLRTVETTRLVIPPANVFRTSSVAANATFTGLTANQAGWVDYPVTNLHFTQAAGSWEEPEKVTPVNCSSPCDFADWVGLGGIADGNGEFLQAGTTTVGAGCCTHQVFFEAPFSPGNSAPVLGPTEANDGQTVYADLTTLAGSRTQVTWTVEDLNGSWYWSGTWNGANGSDTYNDDSAEFIVERPLEGSSLSALAQPVNLSDVLHEWHWSYGSVRASSLSTTMAFPAGVPAVGGHAVAMVNDPTSTNPRVLAGVTGTQPVGTTGSSWDVVWESCQ